MSKYLIFSIPFLFLAEPAFAIDDPLAGKNLQCIITSIINTLQPVIISITVLLFIIGGIQLLTSAGNEEKIKQGKKTLVWAAIGLLIVLSAAAIEAAISTAILGAPGGQGGGPCQ